MSTAERIASEFHAAYEALAPNYGYETRKASAVPWEDVPEANKRLMTAVVQDLLSRDVITAGFMGGTLPPRRDPRDPLAEGEEVGTPEAREHFHTYSDEEARAIEAQDAPAPEPVSADSPGVREPEAHDAPAQNSEAKHNIARGGVDDPAAK